MRHTPESKPVRGRRLAGPVTLGAVVFLAVLLGSVLWKPGLKQARRLRAAAAADAPMRLPTAGMQQEPLLMLWAWETPEDLRTLDPSRAGVAFLASEVLVGKTLTVRRRRQPLRVPPNAWLMAVVRIETATGARLDSASATRAAAVIAEAARAPGVRGLQVDFDATASHRDFYATVLRLLRKQMPADMPLSMTALVSWCGDSSWIENLRSGALPVDEAVPMYFRMGGPSLTRALRAKDAAPLPERLCSASAGIATDETWPALHSGERVYVFRSGPWTKAELAGVNAAGYQGLKEAGTP